ncbi:MAG: hypothetical protein IPJ97_02355 [Proteobacteria bacterium]|nr:hypothetical protein [Pseudomonadota bacterium]
MNAQVVPGSSSRADAQRDRILCAALKCFIEHGFTRPAWRTSLQRRR